MSRKLISLCLTLLMLAGCFSLPAVTASAAAADMTYTQNFDGIETTATKEDIATQSGLTLSSGSGTFSIVAEGGTNKLRLSSPVNTGESVTYELPTPITSGTIETSIKMGTNGLGMGAHHLLRHGNGATYRSLLEAMSVWHYYPNNIRTEVSTGTPSVSSTTGMYHLRTVVSRQNTENDWVAEVYDDSGATPVFLYSTAISAETHPQLTAVQLLSTYGYNGLNAAQVVTIDDISITYTEPEPVVLTEDNYLINEDYTGAGYTAILDTPQNAATMQGLNSALTYGSAVSTSFTVKEKGSTRYLSVQGSNANVSHSVSASFADIQTGNVVMEEKILLAEQAQAGIDYKIGILNGAMTLGSTEGYLIESMNNGNNIFGYPTGTLNTKKYAFTKDGDGFVHIKWVLSRKTAAENWILHIYDGLTEELMDSVSVPHIDPGDSSGKFIDAFRQATFVSSWGLNSTTVTLNATGFKVWQPKDVILTESSAYSNDTKSVSFTASEDLDAESLIPANVTLTDANGAPVTVSALSYNNGTLTVTTREPIEAAGLCTLNLDKVQTARKTYLYQSCTFAAPGYVPVLALKVEDISASGGVISTTHGSITITFNANVDADTLSAVTFTKADGSAIPGFLDKSLAGRELTLSFGTLPPENYTLTLGQTLADEDGLTLEEPLTYTYTVVNAAELDVDYTTADFAEGTYSSAQMAAQTPALTYTAAGQYTILDDGSGQALRAQVAGQYQGAGFDWLLPTAITTGIVTVNLEMKPSDGNLVRNLFGIIPETGSLPTLQITTASGGVELSGNGNAIGGTLAVKPTKAADGYYSLRLVLSRVSAEEAWSASVYDTASSTDTPFYTVSVPADKMARLKGIAIAGLYTMSNTQALESFSVRRVSGSVKEFPYVAQSNCENAAPNIESLKLQLNDDIDAQGLTVTVTKNGDESAVIYADSAYDAAGREVTVNLGSYLEYGTTYTVTFGDAGVQPYSFTTAAAPLLLTAKNLSYEAEDGTVTQTQPDGSFKAHCDVTLTRSGSTAEVLLVLASYNEAGGITDINAKTIASGASSERVTLDDLTQAKAKSIACFVWEKTADGYHAVPR